jgi:hypothetical protein
MRPSMHGMRRVARARGILPTAMPAESMHTSFRRGVHKTIARWRRHAPWKIALIFVAIGVGALRCGCFRRPS